LQTKPHQLKLLQGSGEFFPALEKVFDEALQELMLETYIFDFHAGSLKIAQALERAALRGVRVTLILDGVGTPLIPKEWQRRWQTAGVEYKIFDPVGPGALSFPTRWRRLHRKLCVVDRRVGFCGGINILDDHFDPHAQTEMPNARLDFAVQVIGPCVEAMSLEMLGMWSRMSWVEGFRRRDFTPVLRNFSAERLKADSEELINQVFKHKAYPDYSNCHIVLRDNVLHRQSIASAYINAINQAKDEVMVASAFFLPQNRLLKALTQAAKRGVQVTLLLQGHYEFALAYKAARRIYCELLDAGVCIVEYKLSYLHAKVAFVDAHWCTVGSSNLDPLSLLLAREANLVVKDAAITAELKSRLKIAIDSGGSRVDPNRFRARGSVERLGDQLAYWLMKLAIFVSGKHY